MEQFEIVAKSRGGVIIRKGNQPITFKPYTYVYGEGMKLYRRFTANNADAMDMLMRVQLATTTDEHGESEVRYTTESSYSLDSELGAMGMMHFAEICTSYQLTELQNTANISAYVREHFQEIADAVAKERGINAEDAIRDGGKRYTIEMVLRPVIASFMKRLATSEDVIWQTGVDDWESYEHKRVIYDMTSPSGAVYKTVTSVIASMFSGVTPEEIQNEDE